MKQQGVIFATDLDNTLIRSHRHRLPGDICVEWFEAREQSFFPEQALPLLAKISQSCMLLPVTTRSVAQFRRIELFETAGCVPRYALVANGGILLENGEMRQDWYNESLRLAGQAAEELSIARQLLEADGDCSGTTLVDGLFLCAKSENVERSGAALAQALQGGRAAVAVVGRKLYVLPEKLDKGCAIDRFCALFPGRRLLCAGDSMADVGMLSRGRVAIVPAGLPFTASSGSRLYRHGGEPRDFVQFLLGTVEYESGF